MEQNARHIIRKYRFILLSSLSLIFFIWAFAATYFAQNLQSSKSNLNKQLILTQKQTDELRNRDEYKINIKQEDEIKQIKSDYGKSIALFEKIMDLRDQKQDTSDLQKLYSESVNYLANFNYASADATLNELAAGIDTANAKIAATSNPSGSTVAATSSNAPPGSGFSYQSVTAGGGQFNVAIIAADMSSTRIIVDTASDSDCANNCPVLSLSDYVARNNAFAGINGSFFCPTEYPSCAGKTNSFDTLLMNKNKHYFNSDNNKYSTVPLVYFTGSTMGVRGQTLEWGRDTGVDAVIANFPLYVAGNQNQFKGSTDPKINNKGTRTFVANKGGTVYIGVIYNASAADAANVLTTLGMENALGLDQGGSTALWFGGYKAGPGRNIPNALLFVHK